MCKLKHVGKYCGCLPWFIHQLQNYSNFQVCNIFGNKCYEQNMIEVNSQLNFKSELKGTKYIYLKKEFSSRRHR